MNVTFSTRAAGWWVMITSVVLTMLFLNGACLEVKVGPTVSERDASIDSNEARTLSDGLADDLIRNRTDAIRGKLERVFQSSVKENGLERITSQMIEAYGQPLECEYKQEELGSKIYSDGKVKTMRKFWYALRTKKYEKGNHFLVVEVVPDDAGLAVSSFSIVEFSQGVPPNLR